MGRLLVTSVFAFLTAAIAGEALEAVTRALSDQDLRSWLEAGYLLLKLSIAVAFTAFVVTRGPARRRSREPAAFLACAAAVLSVVLLEAPPDSTATPLILAGEGVAFLGCAWMLVAALALGKCFGVLPEARGLVTHGPYRVVRHPLYLGEFGACAGLVLASPSARNLAAGGVFVVAQTVRMRLEERALTREFPEYADYAARTPRVIPSIPALADGRPRLAAARARGGEAGQTLVEYALIIGFIATAAVAALTLFGTDLAQLVSDSGASAF
jgi:protein-S-isoprenylcysteine O-methyltransferase Ste14/Flp pilus assembly pilin Flp